MRRGEIWTVAGGPDFAGKPRPVVIVQSDLFAETNSVTICPFTTESSDAPLFRVTVVPHAVNGLEHPSRLMADKLTTVRRSKLGRLIGRLAPADLARLDAALVLFLGLAEPLPTARD